LDDTDPEHINKYLSALVEKTLREIQSSGCITIAEVNRLDCLGGMWAFILVKLTII